MFNRYLSSLKMAPEGEGEGGSGDTGPAPEVIEQAKALGWVPKEEFKGRESEWIPADKFVERGEQILPIVKENLRRVQADLKAAKTQIAQFGQTAEEFRKFTEEAQARKEADWAREMDALKAQLAQAVEDGDGKATTRLMDEIEEHKGDKPKARPPQDDKPTVDPAFTAWREKNPWYEQEELQEAAIAKGIYLNKKHGYVGQKLYDAVREEMAKLFPDEVPPVGDNGGMFDGSGPSGRRTSSQKSKAKTYENLPDDAKQACDRFLAKGFIKTREQYVANFDWSGE